MSVLVSVCEYPGTLAARMQMWLPSLPLSLCGRVWGTQRRDVTCGVRRQLTACLFVFLCFRAALRPHCTSSLPASPSVSAPPCSSGWGSPFGGECSHCQSVRPTLGQLRFRLIMRRVVDDSLARRWLWVSALWIHGCIHMLSALMAQGASIVTEFYACIHMYSHNSMRVPFLNVLCTYVNTWIDFQKKVNTYNFDFNFELFEMYIDWLPVCKWVLWMLWAE